MTVLERILQLKKGRGWTEYRLSLESGIAQTTISSWFRKNITPSVASLQRICDAFGITMSQFFCMGSKCCNGSHAAAAPIATAMEHTNTKSAGIAARIFANNIITLCRHSTRKIKVQKLLYQCSAGFCFGMFL